MKVKIAALIVIMFLIPSIAFSGKLGGQIYGTISAPNRNQQQEFQIKLYYGKGKREQTTYTNIDGSYRLYVPTTGECEISVSFNNNWTKRETVFVASKPKRYNFRIKKVSSNKYILERK